MVAQEHNMYTFLDFGIILQARVPWSCGVGTRSVHNNSPQIYQKSMNIMSLLHIKYI